MYNSQEIADRIKSTAKSKGLPLKTILSECGMGVNAVSQMAKGKDMLTKNMASIADYLNCSVDYLLGRTDIPLIVQKSLQEESPVVPFYPTGQTKELIDVYSALDAAQQNSVLTFAKFLAAGGALPSSEEEMLAEAK
ncbi:helix-turn-helix domain-containing protein [Acutalibacter muris]|uniref:helix-turn-helix domain-containing protein n=1 Tax=Acutalibacter muris TaxID=1796620 RepID=UPI00272BB41A|nr:helix-turn-helix transcriptional regulator [Acutalibacter muris]